MQYSDEYAHATTDTTNAANFAVLLARLAQQGSEQKLVADALYDQSVFAY